MRGHFFRRVAVMVALFFLLVVGLSAVVARLATHAFGQEGRGGPRVLVVLLAIALVFALLSAVGRVVRRTAAPIGDVMEAADRVAGGDYTARVEERGPPDMRRLTRSFNEMTERLRASEEQRRNLLADVTHELRTPLAVIQGNLEGLLDGLYRPDSEHLEPVLEETRIMGRLLGDLQTLSTAEAGVLTLRRGPIRPEALVADAVAAVRSQAEEGGVALRAEVHPGLPSVSVDPLRVGEVLANLLQNALRHTPAGGSITVAAGPADDGSSVAFAVRDTGTGIPAEVLPHVFDRFMKGRGSRGAGLGLAIAKSLVEAHGGSITAESEPPGGTTIRFVLPRA